ncbi:MAG TPA: HTH domain-containing protein [Candidatus Paceibacterota bacterium]|nr:HTH domain-containing protein [Candidatus Paceibacterota bacterium]
MSQGDIIKILKANKGKFLSAREIADMLDYSRGSVIARLKRLRECGEVRWKMDKECKVRYIYTYLP